MTQQTTSVVAARTPKIPAELKPFPYWVVWKYETRTNGKGERAPTKVLFDPKSRRQSRSIILEFKHYTQGEKHA